MIPDYMCDALEQQSEKIGTFGHGYTYGGHPLGCAVGVKAIEIYERMDICARVRAITPTFEARLAQLKDHPLVGEVRNSGLMGGVELVADKATKRPFDAKKGVGPQCGVFVQEHGAILRPIGDTVAFCPPMIITEDELNELFDRFERALDDTEAWVSRENLRAA